MLQKETELRELILDYLKKKGYHVWKDRQLPKRPGIGTVKSADGVPDILGHTRKGIIFGIECKNPNGGGRVSTKQEMFLARMNADHGIGIVAMCLEDVTGVL